MQGLSCYEHATVSALTNVVSPDAEKEKRERKVVNIN